MVLVDFSLGWFGIVWVGLGWFGSVYWLRLVLVDFG